MIENPDCIKCKYYNLNDLVNMTCKAFPFGIPKDIIFGKVKHRKVLKGQIGKYVFTIKPEMKDYVPKGKDRPKEDLKRRQKSNKSFRIWNKDGSLYAEMVEGKWIKKPKELEKKMQEN